MRLFGILKHGIKGAHNLNSGNNKPRSLFIAVLSFCLSFVFLYWELMLSLSHSSSVITLSLLGSWWIRRLFQEACARGRNTPGTPPSHSGWKWKWIHYLDWKDNVFNMDANTNIAYKYMRLTITSKLGLEFGILEYEIKMLCDSQGFYFQSLSVGLPGLLKNSWLNNSKTIQNLETCPPQ